MSDKDLMLSIQRHLAASLHLTRRGGLQALTVHYTGVHSIYKKLTNDVLIDDPTWSAAAFLHDAVEDGVIALTDSRLSCQLREYLTILTPRKGESAEEHFQRQLGSEYPQIAAILYANCMHNSIYSEMQKQRMGIEGRDTWRVANKRYLIRAARALQRFVELLP